jgi:hypothetical protein
MIAQRKHFTIYLAAMIGLILVALMLAILGSATPSAAAPEAAPTPVSADYAGGATNVVFWEAEAITADGGSDAKQLVNYESLDLSYTVDQGTVNTTTLKIQFSNDGTNWADGINIVAANAADATGMVQLNNFGRYTRVYADVANSNTVTWTVLAVAK